jgi:uncharacterized protein (DUF1697 family)
MPRYAAFLRGINVGGHRVRSDELRSCFAEVGFDEIATFRASGNVIFSANDAEHPDEVGERIEQALARSLGYEVRAFVRSAAEVKAIAGYEPFDSGLIERSRGKLQVVLLPAKPNPQAVREVLALATDEDRLAIQGRELYWLPSGRLMESALDLDAIGALLGATTMRTKSTIDQIAAKYFSQ